MTAPTIQPYAQRVAALEAEGLTTSDAQGCADAERRLSSDALEGLRLLGEWTQGHYAPDMMAGNHKRRERARILALVSGQPVRVADAGITALEAYLVALSGVTGSCLAVRREALGHWCRNQLLIGRVKA